MVLTGDWEKPEEDEEEGTPLTNNVAYFSAERRARRDQIHRELRGG